MNTWKLILFYFNFHWNENAVWDGGNRIDKNWWCGKEKRGKGGEQSSIDKRMGRDV